VVHEAIDLAVQAALDVLRVGVLEAMNKYNRRASLVGDDEPSAQNLPSED